MGFDVVALTKQHNFDWLNDSTNQYKGSNPGFDVVFLQVTPNLYN